MRWRRNLRRILRADRSAHRLGCDTGTIEDPRVPERGRLRDLLAREGACFVSSASRHWRIVKLCEPLTM